jgi:hypothetical protein
MHQDMPETKSDSSMTCSRGNIITSNDDNSMDAAHPRLASAVVDAKLHGNICVDANLADARHTPYKMYNATFWGVETASAPLDH